jgi:Retroviral aspartyl protease.
LLLDTGASINIIKEGSIPQEHEKFKFKKNFQMGHEEHKSNQATHLNYFNKKHLFHIVSDDFPLPEDGIIGLPFLQEYNRYAVTPKFLIVENKKYHYTTTDTLSIKTKEKFAEFK